MDSPSLRERNLEASRKWYRKHKRFKRKRARAFGTKEYKRRWYIENKEWNDAKERLKAALRPDLRYTERLREKFPLMDVANVPLENEEEAQAHYEEKLRELRVLYGRDPETGRKKPRGKDTEWERHRLRREDERHNLHH